MAPPRAKPDYIGAQYMDNVRDLQDRWWTFPDRCWIREIHLEPGSGVASSLAPASCRDGELRARRPGARLDLLLESRVDGEVVRLVPLAGEDGARRRPSAPGPFSSGWAMVMVPL